MKSHKINITIDARLILNQMTGIGNYLTHLINALLEIDSFNRYKVLLNDLLNDSHPIKMIRTTSNALNKNLQELNNILIMLCFITGTIFKTINTDDYIT